MLVILRENVLNLGRIGDVVKVSEGYARNFLLPRSLVVAADESNLQQVEHHKKLLEKKRSAQRSSSKELADKLGSVVIQLVRKAGDNNKIFGSVSNNDLAEGFRKLGFPVEKREILVEKPIKTLGDHTVTVRLDTDITASVKVSVSKED